MIKYLHKNLRIFDWKDQDFVCMGHVWIYSSSSRGYTSLVVLSQKKSVATDIVKERILNFDLEGDNRELFAYLVGVS